MSCGSHTMSVITSWGGVQDYRIGGRGGGTGEGGGGGDINGRDTPPPYIGS